MDLSAVVYSILSVFIFFYFRMLIEAGRSVAVVLTKVLTKHQGTFLPSWDLGERGEKSLPF